LCVPFTNCLVGECRRSVICTFAVHFCIRVAPRSRPSDSARKPRTKRKCGNALLLSSVRGFAHEKGCPHNALSERFDWLPVRRALASTFLACGLSRLALCTFPFCDNSLLCSLRRPPPLHAPITPLIGSPPSRLSHTGEGATGTALVRCRWRYGGIC
jgi:hypothetical protein